MKNRETTLIERHDSQLERKATEKENKLQKSLSIYKSFYMQSANSKISKKAPKTFRQIEVTCLSTKPFIHLKSSLLLFPLYLLEIPR